MSSLHNEVGIQQYNMPIEISSQTNTLLFH